MHRSNGIRSKILGKSMVCALICFGASMPGSVSAEEVAIVAETPGAIYWHPTVPYANISLRTRGPSGIETKNFAEGITPVFSTTGQFDGRYRYELTVTPFINESMKRQFKNARESGESIDVSLLKQNGILPAGPMKMSGNFMIKNGEIVSSKTTEN